MHTTLSSKITKANILAIEKIKKSINKKKISFTLHSKEDEVVISAISIGADPIFFYIKNNDSRFYPDGPHAIRIDKVKDKIKLWKKIETSMGDGIKKRLPVPEWVYI